MKTSLSKLAKADLIAVLDFIAQDSPERAANIAREIRAKIIRIGKRPLLYQLRPEIGEDVRLATVGRYVILFRIQGRAVKVDRVAYGGRDLAALLQ